MYRHAITCVFLLLLLQHYCCTMANPAPNPPCRGVTRSDQAQRLNGPDGTTSLVITSRTLGQRASPFTVPSVIDMYAQSNLTHPFPVGSLHWLRSETTVPPPPLIRNDQHITLTTWVSDMFGIKFPAQAHRFGTTLEWDSSQQQWVIFATYVHDRVAHRSRPEPVRPGDTVEQVVEKESDHHWRISCRVIQHDMTPATRTTTMQSSASSRRHGLTQTTLFVKTSTIVNVDWIHIHFHTTHVDRVDQLPATRAWGVTDIVGDNDRIPAMPWQFISLNSPQWGNVQFSARNASDVIVTL